MYINLFCLIVLIGLLITQFLIVKNSLNIEKENIEIIAETIKFVNHYFPKCYLRLYF